MHLALAFLLCFLLHPAFPARSPSRRPSLPDGIFATVALVGFGYIVIHYNWIMENPSDSTRTGVILGTLVTLLALEAARRTIGLTFTLLAALGLLYALVGAWVPGTYTDLAGFALIGAVWTIQHLRPLPEAPFAR